MGSDYSASLHRALDDGSVGEQVARATLIAPELALIHPPFSHQLREDPDLRQQSFVLVVADQAHAVVGTHLSVAEQHPQLVAVDFQGPASRGALPLASARASLVDLSIELQAHLDGAVPQGDQGEQDGTPFCKMFPRAFWCIGPDDPGDPDDPVFH